MNAQAAGRVASVVRVSREVFVLPDRVCARSVRAEFIDVGAIVGSDESSE